MRRSPPNPGRTARRVAGCFAVCLLLPACSPNKRYDLIEAELRTRERELADARAQLDQSRNLNRAYEASQQRGAPVPVGGGVFLPVKEIAIGRGTGGLDEDGAPGDEGLMVVVVPKDEDGAAVKVPASVRIAAWEVTPAGLKTPIGEWDVPAEKVRPTWRSGFVSTGYFVAVPWRNYPGTEKVRIAVRFTTLDGRAFEADKDITVKLGGSRPVGNPPATPAPVTPAPRREPLLPEPLPPGAEELPPPKIGSTSERGARLGPPERG